MSVSGTGSTRKQPFACIAAWLQVQSGDTISTISKQFNVLER